MQPEDTPPERKFDEAHALEQLEQLHAQILRARAARRRVEEEFDAFVQGFRSERHAAAAAPVNAAQPDVRAEISPAKPMLRLEQAATLPDVTDAVAPIGAVQVPSRRRGARAAVVIALGILAVGLVAFAVRGRRIAPASHPAQPIARPTKPSVPIPTPAPEAARSVSPQPGVNLELITRRRVWVRVTIDGRRAFEKELPADQRIPLHGDKTILIRAGDAGAVALTRDGRDAGVLGRDGMVATREFTIDR